MVDDTKYTKQDLLEIAGKMRDDLQNLNKVLEEADLQKVGKITNPNNNITSEVGALELEDAFTRTTANQPPEVAQEVAQEVMTKTKQDPKSTTLILQNETKNQLANIDNVIVNAKPEVEQDEGKKHSFSSKALDFLKDVATTLVRQWVKTTIPGAAAGVTWNVGVEDMPAQAAVEKAAVEYTLAGQAAKSALQTEGVDRHGQKHEQGALNKALIGELGSAKGIDSITEIVKGVPSKGGEHGR